MTLLLGLDLGTTNVKAVLTDAGGTVLGRGGAPVRLIHGPGGAVEQDIEEIYSAAVSAMGQAGTAAQRSDVGAVGVSSQGGALQMLDGDGRPAGRVVSWLDGRGRPFDQAITGEIGPDELARRTGHPRSVMALGQLLRLRRQDPRLLAAPNRVGFVGDVIVGRLAGRAAHDATSLSCAVLYEPAGDRAEPGLLARLGLDEGQLPLLLSPRCQAGGLSREAARRTGLPEGIPVSPAVHDQYAAALGVGAVARGDVMFGAGTAWVLLAVSDHLGRPAGGSGFLCRHLAEGLFGQIISMCNGGSAVGWAARLVGLEAPECARIDELLAGSPPGAGGVRCWPLLVAAASAGVPPVAAGRLTGLHLGCSRADLLRAVVEGLAMELRRHLGLLEQAGMAAGRLVMCGRAAASSVTPQIVADAAGMEAACASESDTAALGAAILAAGLLDGRARLTDLSAAMSRPGRTFRPGPDAAMYREVFGQYLAGLEDIAALPRCNEG